MQLQIRLPGVLVDPGVFRPRAASSAEILLPHSPVPSHTQCLSCQKAVQLWLLQLVGDQIGKVWKWFLLQQLASLAVARFPLANQKSCSQLTWNSRQILVFFPQEQENWVHKGKDHKSSILLLVLSCIIGVIPCSEQIIILFSLRYCGLAVDECVCCISRDCRGATVESSGCWHWFPGRVLHSRPWKDCSQHCTAPALNCRQWTTLIFVALFSPHTCQWQQIAEVHGNKHHQTPKMKQCGLVRSTAPGNNLWWNWRGFDAVIDYSCTMSLRKLHHKAEKKANCYSLA